VVCFESVCRDSCQESSAAFAELRAIEFQHYLERYPRMTEKSVASVVASAHRAAAFISATGTPIPLALALKR
jgi:molybdopterin synthase catalytic subunit